MKNDELTHFMKHLDIGHEVLIEYQGEEYFIENSNPEIWVHRHVDGEKAKCYSFEAKDNAELVDKFIHTPVFPDGKSIAEADPEITFTFSSNCVDYD